jgi:hypothetical protein
MDGIRKRMRAVGEDSDFRWLQKYLGQGLCHGSQAASILKLFDEMVIPESSVQHP